MQQFSSAVSVNPPFLSVITVVFNGRKNIAKTINSVLTQDYSNIEYIIIDGESKDGTVDIIGSFLDKVNVFISERDEGIYDAMNKGIKLARGEFILLMNCGDVFASTDAISSAMRFAISGSDQAIFGNWIRRSRNNSIKHCSPIIEKGLFNHQAVIYSRNIHAWHGEYLSIKGFTAADYLFFVTLFDSISVRCSIIDTTIAIIDVNGLSAGLQTISQKFSIDFICGRVSKIHLLVVLIAHPIYRMIKVLLGKSR
jgi:glycosyltransferase involved in cell wall biosynthesis